MKKILLYTVIGAMFFGGFPAVAYHQEDKRVVYGPEEYHKGQEVSIYTLNPQEYRGQPLTRNFNK